MPLSAKVQQAQTPIAFGDKVTVKISKVTLLTWPGLVGNVLASTLDRLDAGEEKLKSLLVLAAPDLIDWAAAEYAAAEHASRSTLPTEVLNADGCRVFGRATRIGWSGAALALSCGPHEADTIAAAITATTATRYSLIATARIVEADPLAGSTCEIEVTSADHEC